MKKKRLKRENPDPAEELPDGGEGERKAVVDLKPSIGRTIGSVDRATEIELLGESVARKIFSPEKLQELKNAQEQLRVAVQEIGLEYLKTKDIEGLDLGPFEKIDNSVDANFTYFDGRYLTDIGIDQMATCDIIIKLTEVKGRKSEEFQAADTFEGATIMSQQGYNIISHQAIQHSKGVLSDDFIKKGEAAALEDYTESQGNPSWASFWILMLDSEVSVNGGANANRCIGEGLYFVWAIQDKVTRDYMRLAFENSNKRDVLLNNWIESFQDDLQSGSEFIKMVQWFFEDMGTVPKCVESYLLEGESVEQDGDLEKDTYEYQAQLLDDWFSGEDTELHKKNIKDIIKAYEEQGNFDESIEQLVGQYIMPFPVLRKMGQEEDDDFTSFESKLIGKQLVYSAEELKRGRFHVEGIILLRAYGKIDREKIVKKYRDQLKETPGVWLLKEKQAFKSNKMEVMLAEDGIHLAFFRRDETLRTYYRNILLHERNKKFISHLAEGMAERIQNSQPVRDMLKWFFDGDIPVEVGQYMSEGIEVFDDGGYPMVRIMAEIYGVEKGAEALAELRTSEEKLKGHLDEPIPEIAEICRKEKMLMAHLVLEKLGFSEEKVEEFYDIRRTEVLGEFDKWFETVTGHREIKCLNAIAKTPQLLLQKMVREPMKQEVYFPSHFEEFSKAGIPKFNSAFAGWLCMENIALDKKYFETFKENMFLGGIYTIYSFNRDEKMREYMLKQVLHPKQKQFLLDSVEVSKDQIQNSKSIQNMLLWFFGDQMPHCIRQYYSEYEKEPEKYPNQALFEEIYKDRAHLVAPWMKALDRLREVVQENSKDLDVIARECVIDPDIRGLGLSPEVLRQEGLTEEEIENLRARFVTQYLDHFDEGIFEHGANLTGEEFRAFCIVTLCRYPKYTMARIINDHGDKFYIPKAIGEFSEKNKPSSYGVWCMLPEVEINFHREFDFVVDGFFSAYETEDLAMRDFMRKKILDPKQKDLLAAWAKHHRKNIRDLESFRDMLNWFFGDQMPVAIIHYFEGNEEGGDLEMPAYYSAEFFILLERELHGEANTKILEANIEKATRVIALIKEEPLEEIVNYCFENDITQPQYGLIRNGFSYQEIQEFMQICHRKQIKQFNESWPSLASTDKNRSIVAIAEHSNTTLICAAKCGTEFLDIPTPEELQSSGYKIDKMGLWFLMDQIKIPFIETENLVMVGVSMAFGFHDEDCRQFLLEQVLHPKQTKLLESTAEYYATKIRTCEPIRIMLDWFFGDQMPGCFSQYYPVLKGKEDSEILNPKLKINHESAGKGIRTGEKFDIAYENFSTSEPYTITIIRKGAQDESSIQYEIQRSGKSAFRMPINLGDNKINFPEAGGIYLYEFILTNAYGNELDRDEVKVERIYNPQCKIEKEASKNILEGKAFTYNVSDFDPTKTYTARFVDIDGEIHNLGSIVEADHHTCSAATQPTVPGKYSGEIQIYTGETQVIADQIEVEVQFAEGPAVDSENMIQDILDDPEFGADEKLEIPFSNIQVGASVTLKNEKMGTAQFKPDSTGTIKFPILSLKADGQPDDAEFMAIESQFTKDGLKSEWTTIQLDIKNRQAIERGLLEPGFDEIDALVTAFQGGEDAYAIFIKNAPQNGSLVIEREGVGGMKLENSEHGVFSLDLTKLRPDDGEEYKLVFVFENTKGQRGIERRITIPAVEEQGPSLEEQWAAGLEAFFGDESTEGETLMQSADYNRELGLLELKFPDTVAEKIPAKSISIEDFNQEQLSKTSGNIKPDEIPEKYYEKIREIGNRVLFREIQGRTAVEIRDFYSPVSDLGGAIDFERGVSVENYAEELEDDSRWRWRQEKYPRWDRVLHKYVHVMNSIISGHTNGKVTMEITPDREVNRLGEVLLIVSGTPVEFEMTLTFNDHGFDVTYSLGSEDMPSKNQQQIFKAYQVALLHMLNAVTKEAITEENSLPPMKEREALTGPKLRQHKKRIATHLNVRHPDGDIELSKGPGQKPEKISLQKLREIHAKMDKIAEKKLKKIELEPEEEEDYQNYLKSRNIIQTHAMRTGQKSVYDPEIYKECREDREKRRIILERVCNTFGFPARVRAKFGMTEDPETGKKVSTKAYEELMTYFTDKSGMLEKFTSSEFLDGAYKAITRGVESPQLKVDGVMRDKVLATINCEAKADNKTQTPFADDAKDRFFEYLGQQNFFQDMMDLDGSFIGGLINRFDTKGVPMGYIFGTELSPLDLFLEEQIILSEDATKAPEDRLLSYTAEDITTNQ